MTDLSQNFAADYDEQERELNARIVSAQQRMALLHADQGGQAQKPQQEGSVSPSHSVGEHVGEILPGAASGAMRAVSSVAQTLDELWDWAGENWEALHEVHDKYSNVPLSDASEHQLPKIDLDTTTGKIVETGTQFLTAFLPLTSGLKALSVGGKLAPIAAGAITDFTAFEKNQEKLSDAVQALAPELKIPVISYLTTDEEDGAFEARMKNVMDGALGGMVVGGLGDIFLKSIKSIKGAIGKEAATALVQRETVANAVPMSSAAVDAGEGILKQHTPDSIVNELSVKLLAGGDIKGIKDQVNFDYIENGEQLRTVINTLGGKMPELMEKAGFKASSTWAEVIKESSKKLEGDDLDVFRDVLKKDVNIRDLDTHVFVLKEVHVALSNQLDTLTKTILETGGSPTDLVRFKRSIALQAEVQAMAQGTSSAVGRALNVHKIVHNGKMVSPELLEMSLHSQGGSEVVRDMAKKYATIPDHAARVAFINKASDAKTIDTLQYYWINSILSSPTTWVVNATSNLGIVANTIAESSYAATKNALGGKGDIGFRDVGHQLAGMWYGLCESLKLSSSMGRAAMTFDKEGMGEALNTSGSVWRAAAGKGSTIDPTRASKLEHMLNPQNAENANGFIGKAMSLIHSAYGVPGKILEGTDELFKTVHFRGYTHMQASIAASKQGLKGEESTKFIQAFLANPPSSVEADALKFAKYGTFQSDLGKAGRALQQFTSNAPITRFIMPFIKTPVNIIKYAAHHSPFMAYPGFRSMSKQMTDDIAAGGVRKELAEAKVATGTALFAVASLAAANGLLTGGADQEYKNGQAAIIGKQAYSITVDGKQYAFSRLDPFGMYLGFTADMAELADKMDEREWSETAGAVLTALSNNLTNKTYLRGLVDFCDAIMNGHGSAGKAEKWLTNFTTSFIPNFMNQTNKIHFDNQIKEVSSYMDAVKAKVYAGAPMGMGSENVAPKRDPISGEPLTTGEGLLGGYLPVYTKKVNDDPLYQELYRIGFKPTDLPETLISKTREGQAKVKLDGSEKDRLHTLYTQEAKINGKTLKQFLDAMIESPSYQRLPDNGPAQYGTVSRNSMVQDVVIRYRNVAKNMLLRESQAVQDKVSAQLMAFLDGPN